MTILDGVNRHAVGATIRGNDGNVEGVGVARYVRTADDPDAAEVAMLVVDAYQGQGVDKALLARLSEVARLHGIRRFEGIVLPDNAPMLGLLAGHARGTLIKRTYDHWHIGISLDQPFGAIASDAPRGSRQPARRDAGSASSIR